MPDQPSLERMEPQSAFEELALITMDDHSLSSVMEKIATLAKRTIPGVTDVSVTLVDGGRASTVAFTGQLAMDLDERQYERGHGPCLDSIDGGVPLHVPDMASEERWPAWAKVAEQAGVRSSLSVPVPLQREVGAAMNLYSREGHAFDAEAIELAKTFAAYAGVAMANMHLYQAQRNVAEQLQEAMQSRAVIEQAKGILMGQQRCSAQAAFDLLVRASQRENRKLRDLAQAIVDSVS